ncbi:DUF6760 family protein [Magnetospirillum aberrantis]|uniref:DUF6760 family protein n=1 Tax=Magnetospirillum aberrantis TaxID=1105283 RepID=UPI003B84AA11
MGGSPAGQARLTDSSEALYAEIAFIAYHFHWPLADLLAMEHGDRRGWCERISQINRAMNADEHRGEIPLEG